MKSFYRFTPSEDFIRVKEPQQKNARKRHVAFFIVGKGDKKNLLYHHSSLTIVFPL